MNDLEFRLEKGKKSGDWIVIFTGKLAIYPPRPATLAEERLWLALEKARRELNELGAG